jgi:tetratricopeptide (TPR) repeat protein
MLETIREHAADKLDEHGESDSVRVEHVKWVAAFAAAAAMGMRGGAGQPGWFERVGLERDNIHVAIRRGLALDVPEIPEILPGVALWWDVTSPEEAVGLCEIVLDHPLPREARAVTLAWASLFAFRVGDTARATMLAEEGVATARMSVSAWAEAWSLNTLGNIASSTGRMADSARMYQRALELAEHAGDPWLRDAIGVNLAAVSAFVDVGLSGDALRAIEDSARGRGDSYLVSIIAGNRCFAAMTDGRWDDAERQARESIALSASFGGAFNAFDQTNHAHALLRLGRIDEASEVARDVVASSLDSSDDLAVKLPLLVVAARLLLELGDPETAATLLGTETAIAQSTGWVLEGADLELAGEVRATLAAALGQAFSPSFDRGAALSMTEALRITLAALDRQRVPSAPPRVAPEPAGG